MENSHPKGVYSYYNPGIDDPKRHYGFKPGLLGKSASLGVDISNWEMFDDDGGLESKEVSPLGEKLSLFDRPNEVERGKILEAHRLESILQQRMAPSHNNDPSPSCRPTKVEVPKEHHKVSMVNTSLKKLKNHLAGFDVVVKERTMATTITEDTWGFEHTKACFGDEIIPFVKALKDIFNTFDQYLIDELTEVQNVFHQMEQAVEQHILESKMFEVKTNQVLNENERLLEQVISKDIVNIIVNSSVDNAYVNV
ncbi:hypothetical protein Tco_1028837 [Tanacetum coccineum]|uniref:Uncharacterized protein n=1 Tax=Tanacetum coccineum TaxID=301880 RepID=A0ABQ5G217_9ASTR